MTSPNECLLTRKPCGCVDRIFTEPTPADVQRETAKEVRLEWVTLARIHQGVDRGEFDQDCPH